MTSFFIIFALYCVALGFIGNRFMKKMTKMTKEYVAQIQEATKQACEELNKILNK